MAWSWLLWRGRVKVANWSGWFNRHAWAALGLAALCGLVCLGVGWALSRQWQAQTLAKQAQVATLRAAPRPVLNAASSGDFVSKLPALANAEPVMRDASVWATPGAAISPRFGSPGVGSPGVGSAGLRLLSANTQASLPSNSLLARSDLTLQVQGAYPELKLWLRDLLGRYPALALVGLDARPDTGQPGAVQATLRLRLYGQPIMPPAADTAEARP